MATFTLTPLKYGKVVGRYVAIVGDGTDADVYPDASALAGTITFTPSPESFTVVAANPDPVTVVPQTIVATLDSDGYITFNGQKGVWLAATDDTSTNPSGFTYTVQYNLTYSGTVVKKNKFSISVPASDPTNPATFTDLANAAPAVTSNGAVITTGPPGPAGPAGINWRGPYTNGATYSLNDAVSYNGSSYVATASGIVAAPPAAGWSVLAAAGTGGSGGYAPPPGGIPKTDLAAAVQTSLGKADTALQSVPPIDYSTLPAGVTLTVLKTGSTWPARPTSRTDLIVRWKGPDPSPAVGGTGMVDNVDERAVTS